MSAEPSLFESSAPPSISRRPPGPAPVVSDEAPPVAACRDIASRQRADESAEPIWCLQILPHTSGSEMSAGDRPHVACESAASRTARADVAHYRCQLSESGHYHTGDRSPLRWPHVVENCPWEFRREEVSDAGGIACTPQANVRLRPPASVPQPVAETRPAGSNSRKCGSPFDSTLRLPRRFRIEGHMSQRLDVARFLSPRR